MGKIGQARVLLDSAHTVLHTPMMANPLTASNADVVDQLALLALLVKARAKLSASCLTETPEQSRRPDTWATADARDCLELSAGTGTLRLWPGYCKARIGRLVRSHCVAWPFYARPQPIHGSKSDQGGQKRVHRLCSFLEVGPGSPSVHSQDGVERFRVPKMDVGSPVGTLVNG
jgi:hypothetical protein